MVLHSHSLHIENFGTRKLVGVLNGTLADLLIANGVVDSVLHSLVVLCVAEILVTLVCVLISL